MGITASSLLTGTSGLADTGQTYTTTAKDTVNTSTGSASVAVSILTKSVVTDPAWNDARVGNAFT
ncbi:hypothetical protein COB52_05485 [Candidatus Kaiserbacteria bacterium]|nr:MAG: hypothetical protein COB52_05485 [Candidatus Kaiserbacteria bacterium]